MSAGFSKRLANFTISLFQSLRVEESFRSFYNVVLKIMKKKKNYHLFQSQSKPRKRCAPNYSIINHFSSSSNKQNDVYHPNTTRGYYRVIYYEALDSLITSLKERFDQPCFKAYENLESLLLKSLSNESIANKIEYVKCVCKDDLDIDQLVVELRMFKAIYQNKNFVCFDDVGQHMQNRPTEDFILIPNVINIIKLVVVNPATKSTAERTFSLARNLKTWLQSTMLPARFNSLVLLKFCKE